MDLSRDLVNVAQCFPPASLLAQLTYGSLNSSVHATAAFCIRQYHQ